MTPALLIASVLAQGGPPSEGEGLGVIFGIIAAVVVIVLVVVLLMLRRQSSARRRSGDDGDRSP